MEYAEDFHFCCSDAWGETLDTATGSGRVFGGGGGRDRDYRRARSLSDDCACPADGLTVTEAQPVEDETLLQAVRLFLQPVDEEYQVGYSPFA
jgi:hypothetical protein